MIRVFCLLTSSPALFLLVHAAGWPSSIPDGNLSSTQARCRTETSAPLTPRNYYVISRTLFRSPLVKDLRAAILLFFGSTLYLGARYFQFSRCCELHFEKTVQLSAFGIDLLDKTSSRKVLYRGESPNDKGRLT